MGLTFLAGYGGTEIVNAFTLDNYLSLLITLTLILGVIFELPLVMIFCTRIGVFEPGDYARLRRYSLLIAVVAAALLTPPDPATQLLLAVPMDVLYEAGIWLSRLFSRPRKPDTDEASHDSPSPETPAGDPPEDEVPDRG